VAVVEMLRALGAVHPVLLAVDDVQWLDPPTARILAFAVRRLGGTGDADRGGAQHRWLVGPDRTGQ
jgi:hypothetical protein